MRECRGISGTPSGCAHGAVYNHEPFMPKLNAHLPFLLLAAGLLVGCGSPDTLQFSAIQLGRSLNSDNTVGNFTTTFKPGETVSVAVGTTGSGTAGVAVGST